MSEKKRRILITGSNGLLGQHLVKEFPQDRFEVLATSAGENRLDFVKENYQTLDLTNQVHIEQTLESFQPDTIINAGAYTNVDGCEDEVEKCNAVNHLAIRYFLESFRKLNIAPHFIQISTDFIFKGEKKVYLETDQASPISEYGRSKWRGEEELLSGKYDNYTIVRTSLVYGLGKGLVKGNIFSWAMEKLRNGDSLTIVDDQYRTPTYVEDLSKACKEIADREVKGVLNIAGPEIHSMLDFIRKVASYVEVDQSKVQPIKTIELGQKAKRPEYSGLSIKKARDLINYRPTSFEESLVKLDRKS